MKYFISYSFTGFDNVPRFGQAVLKLNSNIRTSEDLAVIYAMISDKLKQFPELLNRNPELVILFWKELV